MKKTFSILLFMGIAVANFCQTSTKPDSLQKPKEAPVEKKWFETIGLKGYAQVRYNRLLETNPNLKCEQCDKSIGENGGFSLRRMRLVISGQISKHVYFYFQPDFASSASSSSLNFGQIRDAYLDMGVDKKNEFRFRVGQSKVPFGFENLQSSQNRLPLDRDDATNSATSERDLGVFFYWAPEKTRHLFSSLVKDNLKGTGDYGVFAFGAYNGQTANKPELNNRPHIVARLSYPIKIKGQIVEPGFQAYAGKYVIAKDQTSASTKLVKDRNYDDRRAAASFVLYPRPFGVQAEYNWGHGPEFDPRTDSIETQKLSGGYVLLSYKMNHGGQVFIPFARIQTYEGGKKTELDARSHRVNETEIGIEWQPVKQLEITAAYTVSRRRFEDFVLQDNLQKGNLLRLQVQVNY